jgi:hypothetical protein
VHLDKLSGGFRPTSLLEESFKAIEGLLARRKTAARSKHGKGCIYSPLNRCGDTGALAAHAAMYLDAMVCEDAHQNGFPSARIARDEVKSFNVIQRPAIDAIEEARGIPEPARASLQSALHILRVQIVTKWGQTPPVQTSRGAPSRYGLRPRSF